MNPPASLQLDNVAIPACVRGFESDAGNFNVLIENGTVASIKGSDALPIAGSNAAWGSTAQGMLIPALADLHVHMDKTYVVDEVGAADGDLFKAITLMAAHRDGWTAEAIHQRMARALAEAYACGTRAVRTHLDWPNVQPPRALAVFEQLRDAWRGRVALQCVSLTPLDVLGAQSSVEGHAITQTIAAVNQRGDRTQGEAALLGAFVYRNDGMAEKLQQVFDLARQYSLHLDFHVDEGLDADACGLQIIAELTVKNDFQGKVTCGHACSLSVQPLAQANSTLRLCALAGIHLVALPSTNLYLQGAWDTTPVERGVTRLKEAFSHGLYTSIATDNVADSFFPYGSYDLLDNFSLGVQVAHLSPADTWLSNITTHPARAMGLPWDGKIAVGCPADFVLLNARNGFELMTLAGRQRRVIRQGRFIDTSHLLDKKS
jgi:cytosine/creatinine deaminase